MSNWPGHTPRGGCLCWPRSRSRSPSRSRRWRWGWRCSSTRLWAWGWRLRWRGRPAAATPADPSHISRSCGGGTQRSDHVTASLGLTCSLASSNISLCWRTLSAALQTETMCQCWVSGVSQWSEVFTARVSRHDWALVAPGPGWWGPLGDGAGVGPVVHTSTCPLHERGDYTALGPGNLLVSKLCTEAEDEVGEAGNSGDKLAGSNTWKLCLIGIIAN